MTRLLALLLIFIVTSGAALADPGYGHADGEAEANFLVNLFRFVSWPGAPGDTATICFLGPSKVQARLQSGIFLTQSWARLPERQVVVKTFYDAETAELAKGGDAAGCQFLFVDAHAAEVWWPTLQASAHLPANILTVSTARDFVHQG